MDTIVPSLVIALVLWWLAVRLYNDWLFLSRPRLNALGTIIGYSRINDDGGQLSRPIIRFVGSYSPSPGLWALRGGSRRARCLRHRYKVMNSRQTRNRAPRARRLILNTVAVQVVTVGVEPGLGAFNMIADLADHPPESRRMVHLDKMRHFMGGQIIQHIRRGEDQPP